MRACPLLRDRGHAVCLATPSFFARSPIVRSDADSTNVRTSLIASAILLRADPIGTVITHRPISQDGRLRHAAATATKPPYQTDPKPPLGPILRYAAAVELVAAPANAPAFVRLASPPCSCSCSWPLPPAPQQSRWDHEKSTLVPGRGECGGIEVGR